MLNFTNILETENLTNSYFIYLLSSKLKTELRFDDCPYLQ
jgi:hypothetical protein